MNIKITFFTTTLLLISANALALDMDLKYDTGTNNGMGVVTLELKTDKTFVINGAFFEHDEQNGAPGPTLEEPYEFKGTYTEEKDSFILEFKSLGPGKGKGATKEITKDIIHELVRGSKDLTEIPSTKKVKLRKNPKDLRLYGILLNAKKNK